MKRIIAVLVVIVLLSGLAIFEQVYFHQTLDTLQTHVTTLYEQVKADPDHIDKDENLSLAKQFLDYWNHHKHYFEMLLSHTYTLEMERNSAVLYNHMEQNDYLMTTTDLSALLDNCIMLKEVITPHLHTIL